MKKVLRWFILSILLYPTPLGAATDQRPDERLFSMPIFETEAAVIPWLDSNGFQTSNGEADPLHIELESKKDGVRWLIHLKAHSPLATRVEVHSTQGSTDPLMQTFWDYLDGYEKMPTSPPQNIKPIVPTLVRSYLNAVVCIYSQRNGTSLQLSGFAIDRTGMIATTAHDLKIGQAVTVQFSSGRETSGRVVKIDAYRDLCLIQVPEAIENIIPLNNGRYMPGRDDALFALECARTGLEGIQSGTLDGPPRRVDGLPLWQVHMHIEPGSSGSPVIDDQGRLTAVVKGRFRGADAVGFLIPFETLLYFLEKY